MKPRPGFWLMAWVALASVYSVMNGNAALAQWSILGTGSRVYYGAALVLGALCGAGALWWIFRGASVWLRRAMFVSVAALAANHVAGLSLGTILCATPG